MKSKPIVMKHFSTVHTSYIVNFEFTNNITILTGASATGKTASFSNHPPRTVTTRREISILSYYMCNGGILQLVL